MVFQIHWDYFGEWVKGIWGNTTHPEQLHKSRLAFQFIWVASAARLEAVLKKGGDEKEKEGQKGGKDTHIFVVYICFYHG